MNIHHKPKPEKHERIPASEVKPEDYAPLVHKFIRGYAKSYGPIIVENYEDFYSAGMIGVIKAKKAYDPSRGTFVTIAYHKIFTEVHNLYMKLKRESERQDLSTEEQTELHQRTLGDALGSTIGSAVDYEALGRLLSVEDRQLYLCLLQCKTMTETRKICDLNREEYYEKVATLKDTILEHFRILTGQQ